MSKIVAFLSVTLDGVAQGPGHPDEDRRGGFDRGGWAAPYADQTIQGLAGEGSATTGALMFGRWTYETFYSVWAGRTDNPFSQIMDNTLKYVASRTLSEPLEWANSKLLRSGVGDTGVGVDSGDSGDAADAVAELRRRPGKDILILGSLDLVQSLARRNLIDRYILLIHPLVLGSGRRLFVEGLPVTPLRLVDSRLSTTGVIIATYEPVTPAVEA